LEIYPEPREFAGEIIDKREGYVKMFFKSLFMVYDLGWPSAKKNGK
jgi:hypothetical protein